MENDYLKTRNGSFVHRTAVLEPWVELGNNCVIHPFAVVGRLPSYTKALARRPRIIREIKIGNNVEIGCNAVIFGGVEIGDDSLVGDFAHIREEVKIGKRNIIGRYVGISYESRTGDDCRFQDKTILTGIVGEGCFFGVGVITSNDRRIDLDNYHYDNTKIKLPEFGKRVMVGSGANILAGVKIGDKAIIAAGALIVKDVAPGAIIYGWPGNNGILMESISSDRFIETAR